MSHDFIFVFILYFIVANLSKEKFCQKWEFEKKTKSWDGYIGEAVYTRGEGWGSNILHTMSKLNYFNNKNWFYLLQI